MALTRDILTHLARDDFDMTLGSISKPLRNVEETTPGDELLKLFLRSRTHLFGVVDSTGVSTGLVALDDVLESLLGEEIIDELDARQSVAGN